MAEEPKRQLPKLYVNENEPDYNPFENRHLRLSITTFETTLHLMKILLGLGIMGFPHAFLNSGLWLGLGGTVVICLVSFYALHILVRSAQILSFRRKMPRMQYCDVAEQAFLGGPASLQRLSRFMRWTVTILITINMFGLCSFLLIYIAKHLETVSKLYQPDADKQLSDRFWIVIIIMPMMFMALIRSLKKIVIISAIGVCLSFYCYAAIFYKFFSGDMGSMSERVQMADIENWPPFFGHVVFSISCVDAIMTLENEMETPETLTGFPSVLFTCMSICIVLYSALGFIGYLKYGENIKPSILSNFDVTSLLTQTICISFALSMAFSFAINYYVLFKTIWKQFKHRVSRENRHNAESGSRVILVVMCFIVAMASTHMGPYITILSAICTSLLGFLIPSIIQLAVFYESPGYGVCLWQLWKNILMIIFGVGILFIGCYWSRLEFKGDEHGEGSFQ